MISDNAFGKGKDEGREGKGKERKNEIYIVWVLRGKRNMGEIESLRVKF